MLYTYMLAFCIVDYYRSLEFLNDQHQGEDRVRLGRSYPDNSDEDTESNEVFTRHNIHTIV